MQSIGFVAVLKVYDNIKGAVAWLKKLFSSTVSWSFLILSSQLTPHFFIISRFHALIRPIIITKQLKSKFNCKSNRKKKLKQRENFKCDWNSLDKSEVSSKIIVFGK